MNDELALHASHKKFYRTMQDLCDTGGGAGFGSAPANCLHGLNEEFIFFVIEGQSHASRTRIPRIIRVGTHAVSCRLSYKPVGSSQHTSRHWWAAGHRSSIFRLHVGRALINIEPSGNWPETWSKGQTAPASVRQSEILLERLVSNAIGEMKLLWLNVPDTAGPGSDRAISSDSLLRSALTLCSPFAASSHVRGRSGRALMAYCR
jgi:hypothetical protein